MPTKAIESLLPKELPRDIDNVLAGLSVTIDEVVSYGTHVLNWCGNSGVTGNEHAPLMLSFRHVLEILDATSVLVRKSCFEPAKLLLRSVFETSLNMEYLLQSDFECRSRDFIYFLTLQQKKNFKSILEHKRKQVGSITNPIIQKKMSSTIKKIENEIGIIDKQLDRPYLAESKKEFAAYKKKYNSSPSYWFSLRNGPYSIANLAAALNKKERYLILYKEWSQLTHGMGIFRKKIQRAANGGIYFIQLRLPEDNDIIPSLSISFGLETIQLMIKRYVPQRILEMKCWYNTEIRKKLLALSEKKPILIVDSELT